MQKSNQKQCLINTNTKTSEKHINQQEVKQRVFKCVWRKNTHLHATCTHPYCTYTRTRVCVCTQLAAMLLNWNTKGESHTCRECANLRFPRTAESLVLQSSSSPTASSLKDEQTRDVRPCSDTRTNHPTAHSITAAQTIKKKQ